MLSSSHSCHKSFIRSSLIHSFVIYSLAVDSFILDCLFNAVVAMVCARVCACVCAVGGCSRCDFQEAGEFVDTIGVFNETALNRAVLGGELPTARLLLKYGADANYRPAVPWSESHGSILLDCVARVRDANKLRLTKELLQAGVRSTSATAKCVLFRPDQPT